MSRAELSRGEQRRSRGGAWEKCETCPGRARFEAAPKSWWEKVRQKVVLKQSIAEKTAELSLQQSRAEQRRSETLQRVGAGRDDTSLGRAKVEVWTTEWWNKLVRKWSSR